MSTRGYTILGWIVWQIGSRLASRYTILGWLVWQIGARVAKRQMAQNRVKLGAAGVVALVLIGGIVGARGGSED